MDTEGIDIQGGFAFIDPTKVLLRGAEYLDLLRFLKEQGYRIVIENVKVKHG